MRVSGACHLFLVFQALVDDTEDVSLDFGNEEELAFRKAKIRYVGPVVPNCSHSPIPSLKYTEQLPCAVIQTLLLTYEVKIYRGRKKLAW